MGSPMKPEPERFWEKVDKDGPLSEHAPELGPCWLWLGATSRSISGELYGRFKCSELSRHAVGSHRVSFFYATGIESTKAQPIDHLCRVTLCVNPAHLQQVSNKTNVLRGVGPTAANSTKTHCIHGHEFTPENTMKHGMGRKCRECHRRLSLEWLHRKKAQ